MSFTQTSLRSLLRVTQAALTALTLVALLIPAHTQAEGLTVLPAVGPDDAPKQAISGILIVYTDAENPISTGDINYYPHTPYKIYDSHGTFLRWVSNHIGDRGETPMRVSLPVGRYTVIGKSETQGNVAVPVIIKAFRTTVVNLEKRGHNGSNS